MFDLSGNGGCQAAFPSVRPQSVGKSPFDKPLRSMMFNAGRALCVCRCKENFDDLEITQRRRSADESNSRHRPLVHIIRLGDPGLALVRNQVRKRIVGAHEPHAQSIGHSKVPRNEEQSGRSGYPARRATICSGGSVVPIQGHLDRPINRAWTEAKSGSELPGRLISVKPPADFDHDRADPVSGP